jgi:GNAT superfamily N-acetyltransferase
LHFTSILDEYQGKGIGTWALAKHLARADADRLKAFLIGTPLSQALYKKLGFEEVDSFDVDLAGRGIKGGVDGKDHWAVMVRA